MANHIDDIARRTAIMWKIAAIAEPGRMAGVSDVVTPIGWYVFGDGITLRSAVESALAALDALLRSSGLDEGEKGEIVRYAEYRAWLKFDDIEPDALVSELLPFACSDDHVLVVSCDVVHYRERE